VPFLQSTKHGCAEAQVRAHVMGPAPLDQGEFLGMRHRQGPQQKRVHKRENRCVCAKAQRQRQNSGHREAGRAHQCSGCVLQVTPEVVDCPDGVLLPQVLSNALRIAELYSGLAPRFVVRHATRHVLGDLLIKIEIDFL
jgi:hypothetical protein